MKKFVLHLLFISFAFLTSCGDEKKGNTEVSSKTLNMFETPEFIDKYNQYIGFGNRFDKSASSSYNRYFEWANREQGPSIDSKYVRGVSTLAEYQLKDLEKAINSEPAIDELDGLMKTVLKDATALYKVLEKADSYYEKQDYKDDAFAKGQELHKELVLAYDTYFNSYDDMYVSFRNLQSSLKEFEANKFKENDEFIRYNLMMELNKADEIFALIGNLDGETLKNIKLEDFKSKTAEFRSVHEALEKYNEDEAQKNKEFGSDISAKSFLKMYIREGNSFIKECRNLQERIENNDFSYGISHPTVAAKGSPLKLRNVYSKLVTNYNRIN